jgi:tetratricopeptide (TPR) repeat protein
MLRRILPIAGLLTLASPASAQSGDEDVEIAKAHYKTGEAYYERGRFTDAAREFEEAYRLSKRPALLYNMGKSYEGAGEPARALDAYRRYLKEVRNSSDRGAVRGRVEALMGVVATLVVRASVEGSSVRVDGDAVGATPLESPLRINPGRHQIEIAHEGYATWRSSLELGPGATRQVSAMLTSLVKIIEVERVQPSKPLYKRWWLWTLTSAAVLGGGAAAVYLATKPQTVSGAQAQLPAVR